MKRYSYLLILCLSLLIIYCDKEQVDIPEAKTKLALINPSPGYLKSFDYLITNKVINISDLQITAICYNYDRARLHRLQAQTNKDSNYILKIDSISGDLTYDSIFKSNQLSDIFYQIYKNHDGIIFLGGADFHPVIYGQKTRLTTIISNHNRNLFEMSLLFHLLGGYQDENHVPILDENKEYVIYGFCLGMQTMNVATGGSMYQDIPIDLYGLEYAEDVLELNSDQQHKNYWRHISGDPDLRYNSFHKIALIPDQFFVSTLHLDLSFQPLVRSSHHQAVRKIGKNFVVTATSLDGKVVEALSHSVYKNVLGVQFHPENHSIYDPEHSGYKISPDDTVSSTDYDILLQHGSLEFHRAFWQHFSGLFE